MTDFVLSLLNLCLVPFKAWDNIIIFAPLAFLTCMGALALFKRMMRL